MAFSPLGGGQKIMLMSTSDVSIIQFYEADKTEDTEFFATIVNN